MFNRVSILKVVASSCVPIALIVAGIFAVYSFVVDHDKFARGHSDNKKTAKFGQHGGAKLVQSVLS
jgi:hypothetical protein|tara:strand:- start:2015 stop:2212 length:198 start_codon:yes stop_codon:yes gene_type:complete